MQKARFVYGEAVKVEDKISEEKRRNYFITKTTASEIESKIVTIEDMEMGQSREEVYGYFYKIGYKIGDTKKSVWVGEDILRPVCPNSGYNLI